MAAMAWLNYDTSREYWKMVDIAESAINMFERKSREFERRLAKETFRKEREVAQNECK